MLSYSAAFVKDEFMTDVLKRSFLKKYKAPPSMFLVKFLNCTEHIFARATGYSCFCTAFFIKFGSLFKL